MFQLFGEAIDDMLSEFMEVRTTTLGRHLGLILGGSFFYNSIGAVTFLISAGIILSIFLMSFQILKWK
jgi:hypothetical protein